VKKGAVTPSIVAAGIVLIAAICVQGIQVFRQEHHAAPTHLGSDLPREVPGWESRDVSLGANEFLSGEAEKVLNFDDHVYREYTRNGETFAVYVAYWSAGKMPTRMVASHTPDRCWTENGWRCTEMRFKQVKYFGGKALQPAEWRSFEPPTGGSPSYVMYWHLVSGKTYDYGSRFNEVPNPILWWKDAVQQAVLGSREQYFIRITSQEPLEALWSDPGFGKVIESLVRLGLASPGSQ
jgi:hypothetical protein